MAKLRHPLPVRLFHWLLVPTMLVELVTGFQLTNFSPRWGLRNVSSAKKLHFAAAYVLTALFAAYLYGRNKAEIVPERRDLGSRLKKFLAYELFLTPKKPEFPKYNPGQKLLYSLWLVLIPFVLLLGWLLYFPRFFQKWIHLFGGLSNVRRLIYLVSVVLTASIAGHVYFALTNSVAHLKSIFTGRT
ncbi:MAG: cytochrome b/b6 domain-containing protein [Candidatus Desulforudis sp.]|nr:cytochrome b/b6 domain-containing protein [Desulforudis sp.]